MSLNPKEYEVHITSKDTFGHDVVDQLLRFGKYENVQVKQGTLPHLKFPFTVYITLEADEAPMPSAQVRVFDYKKREVFANVLLEELKKKEKLAEKEAKKADGESKANFSVEQEEKEEDDPNDKSLALNPSGEHWTKEQLEDLEWSVFKKVLKQSFGITGRNRPQMTKNYLEAVEKVSKEAESQ